MKPHPQNEQIVYQAITTGELEIDEQGRVWRVKKRTYDRWSGGTKTTPCKRVRAEIQNKDGYLQVRMMRDGKRVAAAAHRLVWFYFKGTIPQGLTVNHKSESGDKADNRPDNLELATYSQQRHHAIRVLGAQHADMKGEKNPKHQAMDALVMQLRKRHANGERELAMAKEVGMTRRAVWAICHGRTWKHLPLG